LRVAIWQTKHTENTEGNREMTIKTTLRELIIYCIFLVILCISEFNIVRLKKVSCGSQVHDFTGWRPLNGRPGLRVTVWPQGPKSRVCGA